MAESTKDQIYFGVKKTENFFFDKSKSQFVEIRVFNEGERQQYEDLTNRKISMDKESDKFQMELNTGRDRRVLLELAMVRFKVLVQENNIPVTKDSSDKAEWNKLIDIMDGNLAQRLYDAICQLNPWVKSSKEEIEVEQEKK